MHIFVVDKSPQVAAQSLADKHLSSAISDGCIVLCQYYHRKGLAAPLKRTSRGKPLVDWVVSNPNHYMWLWRHVEAACDEWRERFNKQHAHESILGLLARFEKANGAPKSFPNSTGLALMRGETIEEVWRRYYVAECLLGAVWTRRHPPTWVPRQVPGKPGEWTTMLAKKSLVGNSLFSDEAWKGDWLNGDRDGNTGS